MSRSAVLQLDFDGTLVHGDVNEALFRRFAGEDWSERIEAASQELVRDPASPALIEALKQASGHLSATDEECLAFAAKNNPPREGLGDLLQTARRLGMECNVVSYGFDFYIRHYLRDAGEAVAIHGGTADLTPNGRLLSYSGPDGEDVTFDWKMRWTRRFRARADLLVYAGDGGSDVAPAQLADIVFARDTLLHGMPSTFRGRLREFETLRDIAEGLRELFPA